MHTTCERCGMPATPHASASRAFCDACNALASTAARPSSELLFTLPPPTEPDGDRHSVPLAELVARAPTERPRSSFAPLTTPWLYAPVVPAQRPRNVLAAVAMALGALALGASGALAMHVALGEAPEPVEVEARTSGSGSGSGSGPSPGPKPEPLPGPSASSPSASDVAPSSVASEAGTSEAGASGAVASGAVDAPPPPRSRLAPRPRTPTAATTPRVRPPAPARTPSSTTSAGLPRTPSRATVRAAFAAIHSRIEACADDTLTGALVPTRVVLRADGTVQHAQVQDAHVPPDVRSCVAREARAVRVPAFSQQSVSVLYPFRL